jgi:CheY-like chemotaxis protein/predicted transcriptional regulator
LIAGDDFTAQSYPIGSFAVDVLNRILTVLSEQGNTKRTNLAGKTGLNYVVCLRYINFMKTLGWLEVVSGTDQNEYVSITSVGRRVGSALADFLEGKDPDRIDYSDFVDTRQKTIPSFRDNQPDESVRHAMTGSLQERGPAEGAGAARIMLIDDEPDVALTYKSFLTSEGYSVDAFREPEKAVEHFISTRPMHYDLVITDIRMPEMNGLRLYQCLKNIDPSVKVIFVTALDAADELVSVISPGPVHILKKPVDKQVFSRSVKAALQAAS